MGDAETGPGAALEERLRKARGQIQQLEEELELTSRGVTALNLDLERSQDRLRKSEARHRSLFQEHPDAVFALDGEGRITSCNERCLALTGHRPEDLRDQLLVQFFAGEERETIRDALNETLQDRSPRSFETEFVPDAGEEREIQVTTLPIVVGDEAAGIFAIVKDVTDEKKLERQFLQSQKMEAVGRLAGGIVHDFNNILMSIGGHVRLILDEVEEEDEAVPLREDLEEVLRATDRATNLTRQLLAFSRQQVFQPISVVLDEVIRDMKEMIERLVSDRIEIRTSLSASESRVEIDPGKIQQILMNLAVNARDAMPDGGRLTIETDRTEVGRGGRPGAPDLGPGWYVVLRVGDTGSGIDPDVQPNVFDPFFTTKDPDAGTGLGLSTVYGIVKQGGGDISLYSEPGQGTVFKLYLPVAEKTPEEKPETEPTAKPEIRSYVGSGTVLLAEDDASVRAVTARILERHGFTVLAAGSAADALEQLKDNAGEVDLVVSDVILPDQTGPELVDRILELEPGVPIVLVSGYTSDVVADWSETGPDFSFLEKPFTPEDLIRTVRNALDPSAAGGSSVVG